MTNHSIGDLPDATTSLSDATWVATADGVDDDVKRPVIEVFDLGAVLDRRSVADAETSTVRAEITQIRTQVFSEATRQGGARYRRVDQEPVHALKFRTQDRWTATGSEDSVNGGWWEFAETEVSLEHCGAMGNGVIADDAAFDRAYGWCMEQLNGGTIRFLSRGRYRLNEGHNVFPSRTLRLHWDAGAEVLSGLAGAGSVLFDTTHPTSPGTRGALIVLSGRSRIRFHSSVAAGVVGATHFFFRDAAAAHIEGTTHAWQHYRDNSMIRISSAQNCRFDKVTLWGGGHKKDFLDTLTSGTIRFSIPNNGTTLTCNEDVFEPGHVGRAITLYHDSSSVQRFVIASFVDARTVTVTLTASRAFSDVRGVFDAPRGSIGSGSDQLEMEVPCLSADDVGRVVYIRGAEATTTVARRSLRAIITAVALDGLTATLDRDATAAVENAIVEYSPSVEIYRDEVSGSAVNDIKWLGLHLEQMRGCGLVVQRATNLAMKEIKVHALNFEQAAQYTTCGAILEQINGHMSFEAEGMVVGPCRFWVGAQTQSLFITEVVGSAVNDQRLVESGNFSSGGRLHIGDWAFYTGATPRTLDNAIRHSGLGAAYLYAPLSTIAADHESYVVLPPKRLKGKSPPTRSGQDISSGPSPVAQVTAENSQSTRRVERYNGSFESPAALGSFQTVHEDQFWGYDGSSLVQLAAIQAQSRIVSGNLAGRIILRTRDGNGVLGARVIIEHTGTVTPNADGIISLGNAENRWNGLFGRRLVLQDGIAEPGTVAGNAQLFVDQTQTLKIKFSDGTVRTIVTSS